MDNTEAFFFVVATLLFIKTGFSYMMLRNVYIEQIDPSLMSREGKFSLAKQIERSRKFRDMLYGKYPEYPEVDRRAKICRRDYFMLFGLYVIFLVFVFNGSV